MNLKYYGRRIRRRWRRLWSAEYRALDDYTREYVKTVAMPRMEAEYARIITEAFLYGHPREKDSES